MQWVLIFEEYFHTYKTVAGCTFQSGLDISVGKFSFYDNCEESTWDDLNHEADALELETNLD